MTRIKVRRRHIQPELSKEEELMVKLMRTIKRQDTLLETMTANAAHMQWRLGHAEGRLKVAQDHERALRARYSRVMTHHDRLITMVKEEHGPLFKVFADWVKESDA